MPVYKHKKHAEITPAVKKSFEWSYFEKMNENEMQCKLCQEPAYHKSATTLQSHLRAKHPAGGGDSLADQHQTKSVLMRDTQCKPQPETQR